MAVMDRSSMKAQPVAGAQAQGTRVATIAPGATLSPCGRPRLVHKGGATSEFTVQYRGPRQAHRETP
eukprot:4976477-Pyramimonas_sp.AAC.1